METGAPRKVPLPKVGTRFGRWTVIGERVLKQRTKNDRASKQGRITCIPVRCDCGTEKEVEYANLYTGRSQGCGCLRGELLSVRNTKHGDSETPLYNIWSGIRRRCSPSGEYYQRGITCSSVWAKYEPFREWAIDAGYQQGLVIDRINNNAGYGPSNCRWVTVKENARNTRRNRYITICGETKCVAEWAEDPRCAVTAGLIYSRLNHGADPMAAITTPHKWLSQGSPKNKKRAEMKALKTKPKQQTIELLRGYFASHNAEILCVCSLCDRARNLFRGNYDL